MIITSLQKNELILERMVCPPTHPRSKAISFRCIFKRISRTNMRIEFHINITKPVDAVWIHSVFYYKYNGLTFQRYPIDLWENMCDWMIGKTKSYVMEWALNNVLKYSNLNETCPWQGPILVNVQNISMDSFALEESFLPSGNYRSDNFFHERKGSKVPFIIASLYFTVSDHRIEII